MRKRMFSTVVATAIIGVLAVPAYASAAGVPMCFGKRATIVGTNRDESELIELKGTRGDDVIVGLKGSDRIDARGGNDVICGGGGEDIIKAGAGNDKVKGQRDMDTIYGGRGDDRLWGGGNTDGLLGGPGNDRLYGGPGPFDSLIGGPGDDYMHGGRGTDDQVEFWDSPNGVEVDLINDTASGFGDDQVVSLEGIVGSHHHDILYGDDGPNMIVAEAGDDEVYGRGGDDLLRSVSGEVLLDGGEGIDIVSYNLVTARVHADLSIGLATITELGHNTPIGHDTFAAIEILIGSKYDDTLIGDDGDNYFEGNGGDDFIDGRGGTDQAANFLSRAPVILDLAAGTADMGPWGHDELVGIEDVLGSAYPDVLKGDSGPNDISGGGDDDSLEGRAGDDILIGGRGTDHADGGDGTDACDAETEVECELDPAAVGAPGVWSTSRATAVESNEGCVPSKAGLVFIRDLGPGIGNEVFTVRPDGTGRKRLTDNLVDEWGPKWSPDGTKIALSSRRDGNSEIYVMDGSGLNVTRLTENDASDGVPAWSPDGSRIAFSSSRNDPMDIDNDLFVMDADGGNVTVVVRSPRTEQNPSWSPNGRRIAFDRGDSIFTVRSDGTDLKKLTSRRGMLASNPSWSHHGRHILFQAQTSEEKGMDVFVMKGDGSNKRPLISTKKEEQSPTWSPNDRRIAFTNNWRVAVARADGSRRVTLFRHHRADYTVDWGSAVSC